MATGTICILTSGQLIFMEDASSAGAAPGSVNPFSVGRGGAQPWSSPVGPFAASGAQPMATGSICIFGANGQLIPLVPATVAASPMASTSPVGPFGSSNSTTTGPAPMAGDLGPVIFNSSAPAPMATGSICIFGADGAIKPMRACGG